MREGVMEVKSIGFFIKPRSAKQNNKTGWEGSIKIYLDETNEIKSFELIGLSLISGKKNTEGPTCG